MHNLLPHRPPSIFPTIGKNFPTIGKLFLAALAALLPATAAARADETWPVGIQTALGVNWGGSTLADAQIGLWNRAEEIHGLQLGLLNFVSGSPFPCLPLLRFSF